MRWLIALAVVLGVGTGCTRKNTSNKCLADARQFISEVYEHRSAVDDSGQFGTALGQLPTTKLLDRDSEMISCIATDADHRAYYREVLDKDDSVKSERFLRYLLDTEQIQDFGRWEQQKQAAAAKRQ